jgi:hypothetical protein
MIGFIVTSLQLQSIITAHNQWLSTTRSSPYWATNVFSSTVTNDKRKRMAHPLKSSQSQSQSHTATDGQSVSQSVSLGVEPHLGLMTLSNESESYVTTDGQSASLSWYKAPIRGLRPDFYCRTEYVWQLRSWFRGAPSLTRGRVCLLYLQLALASAVFLGS